MQAEYYTEKSARSAASKFGQMIGEAFEKVIMRVIKDYLESEHPDYELLEPELGRKKVTLEMIGGNERQMDTVITEFGFTDPVALLEAKWLKDARHHIDKGSWILQLKEIQKRYSTVRGAAAILAGYWTEGVAIMFMSEAEIEMVLVATDEEVYSTLQAPLDSYLGSRSYKLNPKTMRHSYPNPWDLANLLLDLQLHNELDKLAACWLNFEREVDVQGNVLTGRDLIYRSIDRLVAPLPSNPKIQSFEISLHVDTGNVIFEKFGDIESAIDFLKQYFQNSEAILDKIRPKRRIGQQRLPFSGERR